jgi:hypothetical protein
MVREHAWNVVNFRTFFLLFLVPSLLVVMVQKSKWYRTKNKTYTATYNRAYRRGQMITHRIFTSLA